MSMEAPGPNDTGSPEDYRVERDVQKRVGGRDAVMRDGVITETSVFAGGKQGVPTLDKGVETGDKGNNDDSNKQVIQTTSRSGDGRLWEGVSGEANPNALVVEAENTRMCSGF